ncbi:MAG TPA: monovalent cation/H+ antiporter complex subunit F [Chthoniobacterales bacterium]|jgi:multisubunit Na+/H+ antiporter MnhF subunit
MNIWLWSALGLVLGFVPCGWVITRARMMGSLVALQMAAGICTLVLLLIAQGLHRPSFLDIPLAFVLLTYPATLLFAHFFERWL